MHLPRPDEKIMYISCDLAYIYFFYVVNYGPVTC
jgi:hypothetical protein